MERSSRANTQLDSFNRLDRSPTCDDLNLSRVEDTLGHTLTPAASGMCQFTRFIPAQSDVV